MNISDIELSKLQILDRIEYRQKRDEIKEKYSFDCLNFLFWEIGFKTFVLFALAEIGFYLLKGKILFHLQDFTLLIWTIPILLLAAIVSDVLYGIKKEAKLKELDEEFFHFEIKPKEVKNGKRRN